MVMKLARPRPRPPARLRVPEGPALQAEPRAARARPSRPLRRPPGRGLAGHAPDNEPNARRAAVWPPFASGLRSAERRLLAGDQRDGLRQLGAGDGHLDALLLGLLEGLELLLGQLQRDLDGLAVLERADLDLAGQLGLALAARIEQHCLRATGRDVAGNLQLGDALL